MSHFRAEAERAAEIRASLSSDIELVYEALEGCEDVEEFHARHGVDALLILTQHSPQLAARTVEKFLAPEITGRRVIEIGAGVGLLAIEMARYASSVVAIEADPAWSWVFTRHLYQRKPANLTWVFGTAESVASNFSGDIAVVFTRSDIEHMRQLGYRFAPRVLMPLYDSQWTTESIPPLGGAA